MIRTKQYFYPISVSATKRWTTKDGKKRQRKRKFYQTINPYNKNKNGEMKTKEEILVEITAERDAWLKQPEIDQ